MECTVPVPPDDSVDRHCPNRRWQHQNRYWPPLGSLDLRQVPAGWF